MRRRIALLIVALLAFGSSVAKAQVQLVPKVEPGAKFTRETSVLVDQTLKVAGMDVDSDADSAYTTTTTVGTKDANGHLPVALTFDAVRGNLVLPGNMTVNFDSSTNLAKASNPAIEFILDAFKAMQGATYSTYVTPDNEWIRVEGLDQLLDKAGPMAAEHLKSQFSEATLRKEHEQVLARYPKQPVKPGETWERTEAMNFGSGQVMKVLRQYEYVGTEERDGRTLDKLNVIDKKVVSFEVEPGGSAPFKIGASDLIVAGSKGTIYFDREKGREVEHQREMHITGKFTLTVNDMDLPTEVDLKMEFGERVKP